MKLKTELRRLTISFIVIFSKFQKFSFEPKLFGYADEIRKKKYFQLHLMVENVTALAFILNILSESLPKTKNVPYLGNKFFF